MTPDDLTFAYLPSCTDLDALSADVAIIGIPHGTPYPNETAGAASSPNVIRQESRKRWFGIDAWDFDLGGTLLGDPPARVVDCGDLPVEAANPAHNREITRAAVHNILSSRAVPIALGGDDSVPILVARGFEGFGPFNVLQIDAHIDWKDEIKTQREGYSSTMRRISEMPWIDKIIQVGMRGKGSALRDDLEAGKARGVQFITADTVHKNGVASILNFVQEGSAWIIVLDVDSMDPSIMPAVTYPSPGGFSYRQIIDIIDGLAGKAKIAGFNLVEMAPEHDVNNLSAITASHIIWNLIGTIVRSPYFK